MKRELGSCFCQVVDTLEPAERLPAWNQMSGKVRSCLGRSITVADALV